MRVRGSFSDLCGTGAVSGHCGPLGVSGMLWFTWSNDSPLAGMLSGWLHWAVKLPRSGNFSRQIDQRPENGKSRPFLIGDTSSKKRSTYK